MNDPEDTLPGPATAPAYQPNASDTEQVDVGDLMAQIRANRESLDLTTVLGSAEGRRVIMRVIQMTGLHRLSDTDPIRCQRDEGARSVGIELLHLLGQQGVTVFPQMLLEAAAQSEKDSAALKAAVASRATSGLSVD